MTALERVASWAVTTIAAIALAIGVAWFLAAVLIWAPVVAGGAAVYALVAKREERREWARLRHQIERERGWRRVRGPR